ncbi:MAG: response regulator [Alphaproteobacteria bacterium]|nr:response regulator [Alphaproteobacteria bacterium]
MPDRILVVDDDPQLTGFLDRYLSKEGYVVRCVATASEMAKVLKTQSFDLCVLDLILPDRDGLDITKELRAESKMPIVVLSARSEVFDRIIGLEFGADDYITKPFEPRELLARIKAVLRRAHEYKSPAIAPEGAPSSLCFGDWKLDLQSRVLCQISTSQPAKLTAMEYAMLRTLLERPNIVLSRDKILDLVHGETTYIADRAIDVHIARLRRKIEHNPSDPEFIKTVRGEGYVLAAQVTEVC